VATRRELRRFEGSNPGFSPDGRSLAATVDALVIVFDTQSGAQGAMRKYTFPGHAYSFSADGGKLAVASGDTVVMRNATTGDAISTISRGILPINNLRFSTDTRLLIIESDAIISATDIGGGTDLSVDHISLGSSSTRYAAVSSDGYRMLSRGDASTPGTTVLRIQAMFPTGQGDRAIPLAAPIDRFRSALFSPDDRYIVTVAGPADAAGEADSSLLLWDAADGRLLDAPLAGFPAREHDAVCFSQDGRRLLIASHDAGSGETVLLFWDPPAGERIMSLEYGAHSVTAAALSPDGSVALVGAGDGSVQFINVPAER
jgi:WD40 repeat protein